MAYMKREFMDMSESLGIEPKKLLGHTDEVMSEREMVAADPQAYGDEMVEVTGEDYE